MTKKPKRPKSSRGSFEAPDQWKGTWQKIAAENQKAMAQYMQDSKQSPSFYLDKSLFNPEGITSTFKQSMKRLSEQAGPLESQGPYFVDVPAFLHSTLDQFQKKPTALPLEPAVHSLPLQTVEWEENPFFFLLQQSHLLNVQFLKETAGRMVRFYPNINRKLTFYTHHLAEVLSLPNQSLGDQAYSWGDQLPLQGLKQENLAKKIKSGQDRPSLKVSQMVFQLGENLGVTPGKVVFQNKVFQLIQYEPRTKRVARRPLLIVPPWTHKYYIFDLSAGNSFIRWALESGLTIFVVSWVNPDERGGQKTFEDYILDGLKEALDQVCKVTDQKEINAVGYCSGGTLLACLMGYLKAKKDTRISSGTFLATPFDFSKIDELGIYRLSNQHAKSKEKGEEQKYLEEQYMIQVLNLLRVNDLIWSSDVNRYLLGQVVFPFDMLYWASETLRLPAKMHHTYLRHILIENSLKGSKSLTIDGTPIDLHKISTPLFIMAAHEDYIAPWRSVYPLTQMVKAAPKKFILSASGHITGVFNHPSRHHYHFWTGDTLPKLAEDWLKTAKKHKGSWWKEWRRWLEDYGGGTVPARVIEPDRILEDAPGRYALAVRE